MDINDFRSFITVLFFLFFLGTVWWVFRRGSNKLYKDAANLPFADDDDEMQKRGINKADSARGSS